MHNVRLNKKVFKKEELEKSIDSSFKTFVDTVEVDNDTVAEFFRLYDKLFYEIPAEGPSNTHEFLIRESSKLVQLEKDDTEIQPLLDEITNLRTRLLETNVENIESMNELTEDINKQIK